MKRMKYCGTYVVLPGDFFVFHNNGKSIITEREVREQKRSVVKVPWVRIKTQRTYSNNELSEYLEKTLTGWRKEMKNYFMLDGKEIPMSDETADSLREKQKTYRIKDCFVVNDDVLMLTQCDSCLVVAISIYNGNYWRSPVKVTSAYKITVAELEQIIGKEHNYRPVTIKIEELK